jgi:hypothetical protein
MSFSYGGYNFDVAALSEKASRGKTNSDFTAYVATNGGNVSPPAAATAAQSYYEDNFPDLIPFLQVDSEFINAKHALVSVTLNETKLDPVSFNTTGATTPKLADARRLRRAWQDRTRLPRRDRRQ